MPVHTPSLTVDLETVTPMFLGGADPRGEPELRAASVRGALRFWLRALLGGALGDRNLADLRRAENEVFGSTETGASPVIVRVEGVVTSGSFPPLLHNPRKKFEFKGISPGEKFSITLIPRAPYRDIPEIARTALTMFLSLGGLGKRARRGFGSLIVRSASGAEFPDYSDGDRFSKWLKGFIQKATTQTRSFIQDRGMKIGVPTEVPSFPIIHNQHTKVLFCKEGFSKWEEAMKAFWGILRSNDYQDDPVFGFAGEAGRQASPLHLRIVKTGDGSYHILLTAFRVRFAGDSPNWGKMQRFLDECKKKWRGEWIYGGNTPWQ